MPTLIFIEQNLFVLTLWGMLIAFLSLLYYGLLYVNVKRKGEPALPRHKPPKDMSPAVMRYLFKASYDADCLLAGVLNAAVKDCYRISWRKNAFSLSLAKYRLLDNLSGDESAALSYNPELYRKHLSISHSHSKFTEKAGDNMHRFLRRHYGSYLFPREILTLIPAAISIVLALSISYILMPEFTAVLSKAFLLYVPMIVIAIFGVRQLWIKRSWALSVFALLGLYGIYGILKLELESSMFLSAFVLPVSFTHVAGYFALPKLKPKGFYLLVEIKEFRKYLLDRMKERNSLKAEEANLLPYLIALEVEFDNSDYFEPLLSKARPGSFDFFPFF